MHILMTVNAAWNIWNFRKPLVQALIAQGHRISVLAPPDKSIIQIEGLGCTFIPLDMNAKGLNPLEGMALIQRFKQAFRAEHPDIVLSYTIKNNLFGAMAAKSTGTPFLPNVTGLGTAFLSGGVLQNVAQVLYRRAFRALPIVFFQNDDDRELFVARDMVRPEQGCLLPGSGIDLMHFSETILPDDSAPPVFLMIARLLRDKGVIEFVEAAKRVKVRRPEIRFQLLGAAESQNRTAITKNMVKVWENDGVVEYLGVMQDIRPAISAASCVVLPSYREGAPRTLIEAAAMARPLIATDVPGCRDVVDHGKTGYLCKVQDSASLAGTIEHFVDLTGAQKSAMGRAGRAKMEREFDQRIVVDAYIQAIGKLTQHAD